MNPRTTLPPKAPTVAPRTQDTLTGVDLTDATINWAYFNDTTSRGFTASQLYSTASYKNKDLSGINLGGNDLSGWDFSGQNLTGASLGGLTGANFMDAVVNGVNFGSTFTAPQLYSTASYKTKDLSGIQLYSNNLNVWDFSGQNMTNTGFNSATLTNSNFSFADLRKATDWKPVATTITWNTIRANGDIWWALSSGIRRIGDTEFGFGDNHNTRDEAGGRFGAAVCVR